MQKPLQSAHSLRHSKCFNKSCKEPALDTSALNFVLPTIKKQTVESTFLILVSMTFRLE